MNKEEFNKNDIGNQVCLMNDFIQQYGSLREACHHIGINKSTVQSRFKKANYVLQNNKYVTEHLEAVENNSDVGTLEDDSNKEKSNLNSKFDTKKYLKPVDSSKVVENNSDVGTLEDSIVSIKFKINQIKRNFVELGKDFKLIRDNETFKANGYSNIYDFADNEFGVKKTLVQNLISVYEKFFNSVSNNLYDNFSFSQLVEMTSLSPVALKTVKPTDTVKKIREKKKASKNNVVEHDKVVEENPDRLEILIPTSTFLDKVKQNGYDAFQLYDLFYAILDSQLENEYGLSDYLVLSAIRKYKKDLDIALKYLEDNKEDNKEDCITN